VEHHIILALALNHLDVALGIVNPGKGLECYRIARVRSSAHHGHDTTYHRCVRKLMAKEETDGGMEKYDTGGRMGQ
jgi:hypothetical protein